MINLNQFQPRASRKGRFHPLEQRCDAVGSANFEPAEFTTPISGSVGLLESGAASSR
jgi:hypothetical protein